MPIVAMPRALSGAGSSTPSEEGFVSGSSADEPSYVDRLAVDLGSFSISTNNSHGFSLFGVQQQPLQQKCSSESGASSGETDHSNMFLVHDITERMASEGVLTVPIQHPTDRGSQLPGSWFYEIGSDENSGSPTGESHDDFRAALSLSARNITESVEVPSSEHVAEIVGRQGCKIKALRAKTNTYIKTPVRGEEPIFVVTGRPEDVADAKREIECAAEHFTQIRASRRHSQGGAPAPGHITAYVRVPLRVVGLVVGPKGATIKRIQQDTHTYIITPSREREPIFEVTGLPHNVDAARREIEHHIYQRTGNMPITDPNASIGSYDLQGNIASAANARPSGVNYGPLAQSVRRQSTIDTLTNGSFLPAEFHKNATDISFGASALGGLIRSGGFSTAYSAAGSPPPAHSSNSSSSSSTSSSHMLYNTLELCAMGGSLGTSLGGSQSILHPRRSSQVAQQHSQANINSSMLMSDASSASHIGSTTGSYPAWSAVYSTTGIGAESAQAIGCNQSSGNSSFTQAHQITDMFNSRPSLGSFLSSLGGTCGGTLTQQHCSSLRDEGIGESPSFSSGTFGSDPYHLMMASIWSDLEGGREQTSAPVDAAVATA
uniref:RNA-binding protein MEX3B n=2 Tax=Ascaris TaxID=6251 RepID=F1KRY5_ASCSU